MIEEGSSMREEGDSEDAYDLSSNSNNRNKDPWFGYRLWIKKGYLREHLQTRRNSSFCEDLIRRKMLLIGCGSGIAPLRSILWYKHHFISLKGEEDSKEEEDHQASSLPVGRCVVYLGFRKQAEDFLYKEDLLLFIESMVIVEEGKGKPYFNGLTIRSFKRLDHLFGKP